MEDKGEGEGGEGYSNHERRPMAPMPGIAGEHRKHRICQEQTGNNSRFEIVARTRVGLQFDFRAAV
jgi:hypothetical protein